MPNVEANMEGPKEGLSDDEWDQAMQMRRLRRTIEKEEIEKERKEYDAFRRQQDEECKVQMKGWEYKELKARQEEERQRRRTTFDENVQIRVKARMSTKTSVA